MDQGTLFLIICFTVVAITLGGYAWYLARKERAALDALQRPAAPNSDRELEARADS